MPAAGTSPCPGSVIQMSHEGGKPDPGVLREVIPGPVPGIDSNQSIGDLFDTPGVAGVRQLYQAPLQGPMNEGAGTDHHQYAGKQQGQEYLDADRKLHTPIFALRGARTKD